MFKNIFLWSVFCLLWIPVTVLAEEVHIYLFYGNTCSICEQEKDYLELLQSKYENIRVFEFETFMNEENEQIMNSIKEMYHVKGKGVPFTVVGDTGIYGFSSARIESAVKKYGKEDYYDRVGVYLGMFEDEEVVTSELPISDLPVIKEKENQLSFPFWKILLCIFFAIIIAIFIFIKRKSIDNPKKL